MSRLKLPPNPRHLAPSGPGSLAGAVTTAGAVRIAHWVSCVIVGAGAVCTVRSEIAHCNGLPSSLKP